MSSNDEHSHHHHHHNHHGEGGGLTEDNKTSWSERNRVFFNKSLQDETSPYSKPDIDGLIGKVTAFVQQNIDWIGVDFLHKTDKPESNGKPNDRQVRVLDYACGPGTMTNALAGYASEYIGIDVSEEMIKRFNERYQNNNTNNSETSTSEIAPSSTPSANTTNTKPLNAKAYTGDLLNPQDPTPQSFTTAEFHSFDLVVVGLGYHHFDNLHLSTTRLISRLKPGGIFLILDFLPHAHEDMPDHPAAHTVRHHGFGEEQVRQIFGECGLSEIETVEMGEKVCLRGNAWREPFLARGRKA